MKLETEYLGMSKLFKYAIKSYFKNITVWNALKHSSTHRAASHSPSFCCFCNTLHTSLLAWPFFPSAIFFLENAFQQVAAHFSLYNDGLEIS